MAEARAAVYDILNFDRNISGNAKSVIKPAKTIDKIKVLQLQFDFCVKLPERCYRE